MNRNNRFIPRSAKGRSSYNEQRRIEREWAYSEENEVHLETVRNILIGVWFVSDLALAFLLGDQQDIIIWAGAVGVLLVIGYQIRALWLEKIVEDKIDAEFGRRDED